MRLSRARIKLHHAILPVLLVAMTGACSGGDAATTSTAPGTTATTSSTEAPPATTRPPPTTLADFEAVNRLVVLGIDGNVFTVASDGSDRVDLTDDGDVNTAYFQPLWSPDGTRIAYGRADGTEYSMTVSDHDGINSEKTSLGSFPFYYYWDGTGRKVGLLRNAETLGDLAMEVIEDGRLTRLDTGAPFYFSWEPGGSRLIWHIGNDRLELRSEDGSVTTADDMPGAFQAPQWTESGVFYSVGETEDQTLVRSSLDGSDPTAIGQIRGFASFSATRDGSRIAVQGRTEAPDVVSASFLQVPRVPYNQVAVIDVEAATIQRVTADAAVAFFWNPAGDALAVLSLGSDRGTLSWSVWHDEELTELATFVPSPTFIRDFLPFFDQYAQSMTLWSPEGDRFAFPGLVDGERGIWIQAIDGSAPVRVADGLFVAWSPV